MSSLNSVVGVAGNGGTQGGHSLALRHDGTLWSWGGNGSGQLGDGSTVSRSLPAEVSGLNAIVAMAVGREHSLALRGDGTAWAWGDNNYCQLGGGACWRDSAIPVQVPTLAGLASVVSGHDHNLALRVDGKLWAWGRNGAGQLGDGNPGFNAPPQTVACLPGCPCSPLSCAQLLPVGGGDYSLGVKADGSVWAWGGNGDGQLGDNSTTDRALPTELSGLAGALDVAAGDNHSLGLRGDGTVWAWGKNNVGQLGDGSTTNRAAPIQVNMLSAVSWIASGAHHSLAVRSDGSAWAWGANNDGQLGDGTALMRTIPVAVSGLSAVYSVSAGDWHSLALRNGGTVWAWGLNASGQLGDGSNTSRSTPVQVGSGFTSIVARGWHSLARAADGTVWAWGDNRVGQLGMGHTANLNVPVVVPSLTNVIAIASGWSHCVALRTDRTVWTWGYNSDGQLGDGTTITRLTPVRVASLSDVIGIASGGDHVFALKGDGTMWAWGDNAKGQLGDGTTTSRLTPTMVFPGTIQPIRMLMTSKTPDFLSVDLRHLSDLAADGYNARVVEQKGEIPQARQGGSGVSLPGCVPSSGAHCTHVGAVAPSAGILLYYQVRGACGAIESGE